MSPFIFLGDYMKKVLIGMSGGVDSAVAALLLKNQGYDVCGAILLLRENMESEIADAKKIADHLEIDLVTIPFYNEFESVVKDYFANEYLNGRTPNPCVVCNKEIKFNALLKYADENGFDFIATGHYAKIEEDNGQFYLKKAPTNKDQTYFLYKLNSEILAKTIFPLCDYTKDEIRSIALENNLPVASKSDSQEVCFIPDNDYVSFIRNNYTDDIPEGNFVDKEGNILGKNKGIIYYTIGQRKGLGVTFGKPMYVIKIDTKTNSVTLGEEGSQMSDSLWVDDVNFINEEIKEEFEAEVKIRCQAKPARALLTPENDKIRIKFFEKQRSVTPGQSAVFYDGDRVLGGGTFYSAFCI